MKKLRTNRRFWVVVFVWRGLLDEVKVFNSETAALKQEQRWHKRMNEQEDEIGVFEVKPPRANSSRWPQPQRIPQFEIDELQQQTLNH